MNSSPQPQDDERISAYLDGELTPDERHAFEQLLSEQTEYREAVEQLREVSQALQQMPTQRISTDLTQAILHRAERVMLTSATSDSVRPEGSRRDQAHRHAASVSRQRIVWSVAVLVASLVLMLTVPRWVRRDTVAERSSGPRPRVDSADTLEKASPMASSASPIKARAKESRFVEDDASEAFTPQTAGSHPLMAEDGVPERRNARVAPHSGFSPMARGSRIDPTTDDRLGATQTTPIAIVNVDNRLFRRTLAHHRIDVQPATADDIMSASQLAQPMDVGRNVAEDMLGTQQSRRLPVPKFEDLGENSSDYYLLQTDSATMGRVIAELQSQAERFETVSQETKEMPEGSVSPRSEAPAIVGTFHDPGDVSNRLPESAGSSSSLPTTSPFANEALADASDEANVSQTAAGEQSAEPKPSSAMRPQYFYGRSLQSRGRSDGGQVLLGREGAQLDEVSGQVQLLLIVRPPAWKPPGRSE